MPYGKSPRAVLKAQEYLETIARNDKNGKYETIFITADSRHLAYRLREATYFLRKAAGNLDSRFIHLEVITKYQYIESYDKKKLHCRRIIPVATEDVSQPTSSIPVQIPIVDQQDIIMYLVEHRDVPSVVFQIPIDMPTKQLDRWCSVNSYKTHYSQNYVQIEKI